MESKTKAILFGPFIGELNWEIYRFAPYAIYQKKKYPAAKLIVLTRQSRFDLYGKYASVLVPLKIRFDQFHKANKFRLENYPEESYELIKKFFVGKYEDKTEIINHFCPEINWMYSLKWQFPREKMDYDFQPRNDNYYLVDDFLGDVNGFILADSDIGDFSDERIIKIKDFAEDLDGSALTKQSSFLGCLMCLVQKSSCVIGNLNSATSRFAILMGKPLIALNEKRDDDSIHLLNPKGVPIFKCSNLDEGLRKYEDHF